MDETIQVTSTAFNNNGNIPDDYTCNGKGISPALSFENIPEGVQSLALIVDDPDAPVGVFTHWLVWNINPQVRTINFGEKPEGAIEGKNDFGVIGYGGPCPPSGQTHHYYFRLYALDSSITLAEGSSRSDLESMLKDHIISSGVLVGLYKHDI